MLTRSSIRPGSVSRDELPQWEARLQSIDIPVMRQTARRLARFGENPDKVDAQQLTDVILNDPLMTLRVLADAGELRRQRIGRFVTEVETVTAAILMMGTLRFYERYQGMRILEDCLGGDVEALRAVRRLLRRSARAGTFAAAFCAQRQDPDVAIIYESALLHDFAEVLLWIEYPQAMRDITEWHREHRVAGVTAAQRDVLGFAIADLAQALMKSWSLPTTLRKLASDGTPEERVDGQVRTARLAVRLARHSESGWSHPALSTDLVELAGLLNLSLYSTRAIVLKI